MLLGDYVVHGVVGGIETAPEEFAHILGGLSAPLGVYGVLGNHDWWLDGPRVSNALQSAGKPAILGVSADITEREQLHGELMRSRHAVIFGLAKLAESRDDDTGRHLERICRFTEILGGQLAGHHPDLGEE